MNWWLIYWVTAGALTVTCHRWLAGAAWMAPRWLLVVLALLGGLFWPVPVVCVVVAWARERFRG